MAVVTFQTVKHDGQPGRKHLWSLPRQLAAVAVPKSLLDAAGAAAAAAAAAAGGSRQPAVHW